MNPAHRPTASEVASKVLQAMEWGIPAAVFVVTDHPDSTQIGRRLYLAAEESLGSLGDPAADEAARDLAVKGLRSDSAILPGLHSVPLAGEAQAEVYLELHHPPVELVIVGAGHLAQPLCTLGALLGMEVFVLDDRPDFATKERFPEAAEVRSVDFSRPFEDAPLHPWSHVLLVTRGHRYDYECLRMVLEGDADPAYIGMIGSRRRVKATFKALLEEGVSRERLRTVRAPIGLDLGAETPAEIAVAVAAELVQVWRGGSGRPLQEKESVLDRLLPEGPDTDPTEWDRP
jgi:xanthine dehydrogenase accessory factor